MKFRMGMDVGKWPYIQQSVKVAVIMLVPIGGVRAERGVGRTCRGRGGSGLLCKRSTSG